MHYTDVTMSPMASQITNLGIVYSTIYSGSDQRKYQSSASQAFEFSAQKGSNAENVFIWWCHHGRKITLTHSWLWSRSGWPGCDETLSWCVALPTRCIYQVSNWYLKACWKKVQKTFRWLGPLLTPASGCFCPQRAKNCPTMTKISRGQDTHFISVCTKSEASI